MALVTIKRDIVEDTISALKEVLNIPNTTIKPSQVPDLIRGIPRYILSNYTNSDNVTNSTLQTLIQSVKTDTTNIVNSLEFTDSEDADDIIDEVLGGS